MAVKSFFFDQALWKKLQEEDEAFWKELEDDKEEDVFFEMGSETYMFQEPKTLVELLESESIKAESILFNPEVSESEKVLVPTKYSLLLTDENKSISIPNAEELKRINAGVYTPWKITRLMKALGIPVDCTWSNSNVDTIIESLIGHWSTGDEKTFSRIFLLVCELESFDY